MSSAEIKEVSQMDFQRQVQLELTPTSLLSTQALDLPSIKSHRWRIQPCSAVTGENLVEGLDWVVNDVAGRYVSVFPSLLFDA